MIEIKNVHKSFGNIKAIDNISLSFPDTTVFGLLGTNGAGKSTMLRMLAGILKPDEGEITLDGNQVWDNPAAKGNLFFISDDQYYFSNLTAEDAAAFYKVYYPNLDEKEFYEYLMKFGLDKKRKLRTFSKGMKKQLSIILGISSGAKYLLCDETFDGLDPVMRQAVKSIFAKKIDEGNFTPIIASHNLRELEDICDHVGILHKGGILLSKDLESLKLNLIKIQAVLPSELDKLIHNSLDIVKFERRGKLVTMIVRGNPEEILRKVHSLEPLFCESLPLSLEEIFICETEVVGYDIKNLII
ncbi:MAG: ABC transporter ATP-binding protein [Lachnospiraceae bacterium]|jgi:ABC-2 type transport system ATP-binding protein